MLTELWSQLNEDSSISSAIERNGVLPEISVDGFYLPNYGAGKASPQAFDPNKNYMGFIIMAIYDQNKAEWYTDHSKTFL